MISKILAWCIARLAKHIDKNKDGIVTLPELREEVNVIITPALVKVTEKLNKKR